jgi:hypothetical protein
VASPAAASYGPKRKVENSNTPANLLKYFI